MNDSSIRDLARSVAQGLVVPTGAVAAPTSIDMPTRGISPREQAKREVMEQRHRLRQYLAGHKIDER